jgi:hypothetical protein
MQAVKPTRNVKLLLGFLVKGEVDAIFKQTPFELPDGSNLINLWRQSADAVRDLPPSSTGNGARILDVAESSVIEEVRARQTYRKHYESTADYQFALLPADSLLAPQWFADMDYIEELSHQIPSDATLDQQIRFAMAEGSITEPIIAGNQVVFTSHRRDLHAEQIPVFRQTESGEFEITTRAYSRPNYIQAVQIGSRFLLTNGVHKVCALNLRGHQHIPCLLRRVNRIEESGLNTQQTSLFRPELMNSPRPAHVLDFLSNRVAVRVGLRSMYQVLRVGFGIEMLNVPAIPSFLEVASLSIGADATMTARVPAAQVTQNSEVETGFH